MTKDEYGDSTLELLNKIVSITKEHLDTVPEERRESMRECAVVNYLGRIIVAHALEGRSFKNLDQLADTLHGEFMSVVDKLHQCLKLATESYAFHNGAEA